MLAYTTSRDGVRSPRILYGTAWKQDRTDVCVRMALQMGFRGIDTACQPKHYNEAGVGAGIAACLGTELARTELYLQTKFTPLAGQDPKRVPYDPLAALAEQVTQSLQTSLRNLQTGYVDGLVLHSPLRTPSELMEVWQAMEALRERGSVKQLGISNCYDPDVLALLFRRATIKPAVVQNRFYADTGYDRDIRAFCAANQIVYQSFWTLTANPQLLAHATIGSLAKRHGRSPAQILFRCLTQLGIVPLTGTTSVAHMRDDLAIFEFELQDDEQQAVVKLFE